MAKAKSSRKSEFEVLAAKLRKEREFVARKLKELTETKGSDAAWEWWLERMKRHGVASREFIEEALEALSKRRDVGRRWDLAESSDREGS
ncbi:MAG: hypothetical protein N3B10_06740 [Armatimonadetes bacterium]|nr:hypothetical protein [Armatimonadota bacterium]